MASSNYVYDNGKKRHNRVNMWQLNKTVQEQARNIQLLQRAISHQANLNAQQVLLNESLSDRIALLEQSIFQRFARWFRK